jgi:hypothetical protein
MRLTSSERRPAAPPSKRRTWRKSLRLVNLRWEISNFDTDTLPNGKDGLTILLCTIIIDLYRLFYKDRSAGKYLHSCKWYFIIIRGRAQSRNRCRANATTRTSTVTSYIHQQLAEDDTIFIWEVQKWIFLPDTIKARSRTKKKSRHKVVKEKM